MSSLYIPLIFLLVSFIIDKVRENNKTKEDPIKKVKKAEMILAEIDNKTEVIEVNEGIKEITNVPIKKEGNNKKKNTVLHIRTQIE